MQITVCHTVCHSGAGVGDLIAQEVARAREIAEDEKRAKHVRPWDKGKSMCLRVCMCMSSYMYMFKMSSGFHLVRGRDICLPSLLYGAVCATLHNIDYKYISPLQISKSGTPGSPLAIHVLLN